MAEKAIYEVDEHGNITAEYASQHEAAAANGITQPAVRKSCDRNGAIVQKCGKGFRRKTPGMKPKKQPEGPCCARCVFSMPLGGSVCCNYQEIVGHKRPVPFAQCEIWKNPQGHIQPKRKVTKAEADKLTAIIMGGKKHE